MRGREQPFYNVEPIKNNMYSCTFSDKKNPINKNMLKKILVETAKENLFVKITLVTAEKRPLPSL